jgi:Galactose oxidase, central domain/Kelch motif
MTDLDSFERRLAVALRSDADLGVAPFDPVSIARAAIHSGQTRQRRALRVPRRITTMNVSARFAVAAVIGVIAIGGTLYLTRPSLPAVGGPSATPGVSASPSESASPSAVPSPTVVPARAPSWTATGSMARSREGAVAVQLQDGKVLVVGGNSNVAGPAAEVYDPRTRTWTATGPMVTPGWQFAAAGLLDGRVLVASADGTATSAELYDPSTGSWTATGSMGTARYDTTLTLLDDGKVLLAGGDTVAPSFNPSVASAELYDPVTGSWTPTGSMGSARSGHTATLLRNGKVLVAGGSNDNDTLSYRLASAELYDPGTGRWTPTHDMTEVRQSHTATLLLDGRVLVVGGSGVFAVEPGQQLRQGISKTAELYDPTTGSWTAAGSLRAPLLGFTATLLPDGRVLVAGGLGNRDVLASTSAELFDPITGTWATTSDMIQGRAQHTTTLLPDGTVLVAGGISGHDAGQITGWLASAELYDPGSGR